MSFIQMSVPLVFWGQRPPAHEVTCICRTEEKKGVATASRTGQVVLWDILRERGTEKIKVGRGWSPIDLSSYIAFTSSTHYAALPKVYVVWRSFSISNHLHVLCKELDRR